MKKKRSKQASIAHIMSAARHEFAEHGFSGARVDAIAARARVNKALLYFHIGSKADLYEKVLHETIGNTADVLDRAVQDSEDPTHKLTIYIRCLLTMIRENPLVPSIMLRELAGGGHHLPDLVAKDFTRLFSLLDGILRDGADAGVFRNTAPVLIHCMVVGPAIFYSKIFGLTDRFSGLLNTVQMEKNFTIDPDAEIERLVLQSILK